MFCSAWGGQSNKDVMSSVLTRLSAHTNTDASGKAENHIP